LQLWDSNGKAIGLPLRGHQGAVNSVTFSPDGLKIVSGSDDRAVRLWDTKGMQLAHLSKGISVV
jgi:WD40 repeat protein